MFPLWPLSAALFLDGSAHVAMCCVCGLAQKVLYYVETSVGTVANTGARVTFPPSSLIPPQSGWQLALDDAGKPFAPEPTPAITSVMRNGPVVDLIVLQKAGSQPASNSGSQTLSAGAGGSASGGSGSATTAADSWAQAKEATHAPAADSDVVPPTLTGLTRHPSALSVDGVTAAEPAAVQAEVTPSSATGRVSPVFSLSGRRDTSTTADQLNIDMANIDQVRALSPIRQRLHRHCMVPCVVLLCSEITSFKAFAC